MVKMKSKFFLFSVLLAFVFIVNVFAVQTIEELEPINRKYQQIIDAEGLNQAQLYSLVSRWLRENDITVDKAKKDIGLIKAHGSMQIGIWGGERESSGKFKNSYVITIEVKDEKVRFTFSELLVQISNGSHSRHYSAKGEYLTQQAINCFAKYADSELLDKFKALVIKKQEELVW